MPPVVLYLAITQYCIVPQLLNTIHNGSLKTDSNNQNNTPDNAHGK